ncbi:MAG: hypothetical protein L0212_07055 [Acidobacteria bacterium]|nr:hypothetical protein [Acidobacteriota bacterium]
MEIERLGLDVRLDPAEQALSAKANLLLRNRGANHVEVVDLFIPAPLGTRTVVERAWDYHGQLAFRADPVEANQSQQIQVALRSPLKPGGKQRIVISYTMALSGLPNSPTGTALSPQRAGLAATGWYPAPAVSAPPSHIFLSVRLPKEWRVWALAKPKRVLQGQASASYEMTIKNAAADALLFRAAATDSPD